MAEIADTLAPDDGTASPDSIFGDMSFNDVADEADDDQDFAEDHEDITYSSFDDMDEEYDDYEHGDHDFARPEKSDSIDLIEKSTKRVVDITSNEDEVAGKFDEQAASPLFAILPREVRDEIWAFCLAPFEDDTRKFEETAYYYRPGHTACLKTDVAVLLTCRRVWLEANAMPMLQAEHSFYFDRAALDRRTPDWMMRLTERNRQNFGHLHMFVQMFRIEGLRDTPGRLRRYFLDTPAMPTDFQPRMFHVTLRHTDWWNWESEAPLRLQDSWVQTLLDTPDLRSTETLKLELETLDYKVVQLQPIIERIQRMESAVRETHLVDGKPVRTMFVLTNVSVPYTWEGPANINKHDFRPYQGRNTLKYHVVTLTWKLRFPDIPRAFVPHLRRAPRIQPQQGGHAAAGGTSTQPEVERLPPLAYAATPVPYVAVVAQQLNARKRKRALARQAAIDESAAKRGRLAMYEGREVQRELRNICSQQAEDVERWRRLEHVKVCCHIREKYWRERWQEERSLLRFID